MARSTTKRSNRQVDQAPSATRGDDRNTTRELQPTTHTRLDPINTAAEDKMVQEERERAERDEQEAVRAQEEEAKKQQELFEQRQNVMLDIIRSAEGFVVQSEDNGEAISEAYKEGLIYQSNVQRGPGGLEVEERWFLSSKGFDALRNTLGPNMGKK